MRGKNKNTKEKTIDSENISDVNHIRSLLNCCKFIAVLEVLLLITLAIISFATAKEEVTYTFASGRPYVKEEINPEKIGAGVGYLISAPLVGVFTWRLSTVFCGFLYDVKKIKKYVISLNKSHVDANVEASKSTNVIED